MALNIKNDEVDRLARELAARSGKSITEALQDALRAELARVTSAQRKSRSIKARLLALGNTLKQLPVYDARTPEAMLYDEHGMPR